LRIVKLMYFDAPTRQEPIIAPFQVRAVMAVNAFALLAVGLLPGFLINVCYNAIARSL
jgi:NADH-quinone oxidoreductase subunit N